MKHKIKFFLIITVLAFSSNVSAQLTKQFLNDRGKIVTVENKATCYRIIEHSQKDSIWYYNLYNLKNVIRFKGSYVDEEMTIPHGRFTFYNDAISQKKLDEHHSTIDTIVYVSETGFYLNGLKQGIWMNYYPNNSFHY